MVRIDRREGLGHRQTMTPGRPRDVGGIVVVEDVFTLPGVGRLLLDAIFQRDYPVVQGVILILAAAFMTLNLAVDLLYALIDPRLRRG